ncbi:MAG: ABC transporter ATP-binding protein/permease [Oscillospiraceae bacterium]|jgi:ABC-type multidrug transport system fused ATPase/permease subunit|nr:ABC transporter ATP-binding protein/permease [Oscillospiraceae bacterium]
MLKQAARAVAVMLRYARRPAALCIALMLAQAVLAPVTIYLTGRLVNGIGEYAARAGTFEAVASQAAMLIGALLVQALAELFCRFARADCTHYLQHGFSDVVLGKFKRLEYACFEDPDVLNSLERMGAEPHNRINELFFNIVSVAAALVSLVGTVIVFAQVSAWFAVAYGALLAPMLWFYFKSAQEEQKLWNTEMPNWRRRTYLSALLADKHAVSELKIFGALPYILKKWKITADKFRGEFVRLKLSSIKFNVLAAAIECVWAAYVIVSLLTRLTGGTVTLGAFVACITSLGATLSLSSAMGYNFSFISRDCIEMHHFGLFMQLPEVSGGGGSDAPITAPEIRFDDVYFTYPKTSGPVLRGVTFSVRPGERVALVGENGAGKSTIVKLLCGLYKPDSGDIRIGGAPIAELSASQLRRVFSVVFQDFGSYELTLRENLAFGDIGKLGDDGALRGALERGLWSGSMALDTNLGKIEDDGVDLSGGQWQRIAVARSLVGDSAFVILDEPTAALDPLAESRMYETFQSVLRERGCVMISHRLASAKLADKIIVLNGGAVAQSGAHGELMKAGGLYRDMFTAQAAWYADGGGAE